MKKINGFTITRMSMSGFKCFEETTTFDFGDTTFITAQNGQGKSSIADAIAFVFVGTPFFGDKGLDRLHNRNTDEMMVGIDFIDDSGETHNLTRTRKRENTTITYNGLAARQSNLNEAFGDKDIFLSILNPLYFINVLGDSGKNLLEKLLPVVSHEEVLVALPESTRTTLERQTILSPEGFIKNRRAELRDLEKTLIGYRSQQDLVKQQQQERAANIKQLRTDIDTIAAEMLELAAIRDDGIDREAEQSTLTELRKRRTQLLSDAANNTSDKSTQGIMAEIQEAEKLIAKLEAKPYKSTHTKQIAEAEAGFKVLSDEHNRIKASLENTVMGNKCAVCSVEITADNIEAVKTGLQNQLALLRNDGITAKKALAEIKAQDDAAKREFEEQKAAALATEREKLAALNQRLQEINIARELDSEDYGAQIMALETQVTEQEYRLANGNLMPEQAVQLVELESAKKECEAKIDALNNIADHDYTTFIEDTQAEIVKIKILINEGINYMAKRIELMLGGVKMNNTEIVLMEIIKSTGEVKDCFRFSYEGRDYKCLSLSEKVRAGLEVATLIQRLSGRNYPIFVDNGESICSFGSVDFSGQVLLTRVVRDQNLQVTHKNRTQKMTA